MDIDPRRKSLLSMVTVEAIMVSAIAGAAFISSSNVQSEMDAATEESKKYPVLLLVHTINFLVEHKFINNIFEFHECFASCPNFASIHHQFYDHVFHLYKYFKRPI